jgi:predicted RNA-binding Zn ribbon-like protein
MTSSEPSAPDALETSLDFVNTFGLSDGRQFDDFQTTRQAIDWLHERTDLDPALIPDSLESPAVLRRIGRARSAFRELWDATVDGRAADPGALREVNRVLRHRCVLELAPAPPGSGTALRLENRFTGDEVDCALAGLAEPIVRTVGSTEAGRARICANDGCRWVFFDDSRTHRRRWCDMSSCGNRAKAARHRARAKAAGSATGEPAGAPTAELPGQPLAMTP